MKNEGKDKTRKVNEADQWTITVFEDLEIAQRTRKPPSEELTERLNHLVKKPPFCWTSKYKDHLPRL